ncbi:MAG: hypothetical protein KF729_22725 [Sandaracinaceae bacterium]|nr:hypothetical protein [Sandaracinaceae bacterium]
MPHATSSGIIAARIFFSEHKPAAIKRQITSLLGGHVLRADNPFVRRPRAQLAALVAKLDEGAPVSADAR